MSIKQGDLRAAAIVGRVVIAESIKEAKAAHLQTAFLCHSHLDVELARGLQTFLNKKGWSLYIDWLDEELPSVPDKDTAETIKGKIVDSDWFLFLATENSTRSRWCPWEIGYADAKKGYKHIIVIQTVDDGLNNYGNEYLHLYKNLRGAWVKGASTNTKKEYAGYAVFSAKSNEGIWIKNLKP